MGLVIAGADVAASQDATVLRCHRDTRRVGNLSLSMCLGKCRDVSRDCLGRTTWVDGGLEGLPRIVCP